jgi:Domain of unknown function (DUF427)
VCWASDRPLAYPLVAPYRRYPFSRYSSAAEGKADELPSRSLGGERSTNAVWSYDAPYAAVAAIEGYLAFYPDRVSAIEEQAAA